MRRREFIAGLASAVWPLAARSQQRPLPVIGFLSGITESAAQPLTSAFRRGLGEQGFVEGKSVEILYGWADTHYDRLPLMAAEMVRRQVTVFFAGDNNAALAAKSATATLPIVFTSGGDPVEMGLVASLNRPGGNLTGFTILNALLTGKRFELLHEVAPAVTSIGHLNNPGCAAVASADRERETAARIVGVNLVSANARTPGEIERAFTSLVGQRVGPRNG